MHQSNPSKLANPLDLRHGGHPGNGSLFQWAEQDTWQATSSAQLPSSSLIPRQKNQLWQSERGDKTRDLAATQ